MTNFIKFRSFFINMDDVSFFSITKKGSAYALRIYFKNPAVYSEGRLKGNGESETDAYLKYSKLEFFDVTEQEVDEFTPVLNIT